ncbi:CLUMA_CG020764, isoform A [Clunio marinus]|uniref:CLUMA_CG020764, isoform A n=1 Tax=Clunio marinus TaxID=568069 RepID=A0A1J1J749_9DIPT|nr:CLUMA_CG020764, isoform A [Clunio marinus]
MSKVQPAFGSSDENQRVYNTYVLKHSVYVLMWNGMKSSDELYVEQQIVPEIAVNVEHSLCSQANNSYNMIV